MPHTIRYKLLRITICGSEMYFLNVFQYGLMGHTRLYPYPESPGYLFFSPEDSIGLTDGQSGIVGGPIKEKISGIGYGNTTVIIVRLKKTCIISV